MDLCAVFIASFDVAHYLPPNNRNCNYMDQYITPDMDLQRVKKSLHRSSLTFVATENTIKSCKNLSSQMREIFPPFLSKPS